MEEGPKTVEKGHVFPAETKTEESWFLESVGELEADVSKETRGRRAASFKCPGSGKEI